MITGILLAAGVGSRFGSNKLLHPLPDGTPIAIAAARNLLGAVDKGIAVVRPSSAELADLLKAEGFQVIISPDADEGMGNSIAFGIAAAKQADGWLITLADMPYIRPGTLLEIRRLLEQAAPLVFPVYHGQRGNPVGFGKPFLNALLSLSGDQGGRSIVNANLSLAIQVACDDPGVLVDIDTREDILR